jgi:hypothetical protein
MRVRVVAARRALWVKARLTNALHGFWNRAAVQPKLITNRIERPPKETKSVRDGWANHGKNQHNNEQFYFHRFTLNILDKYINYVKHCQGYLSHLGFTAELRAGVQSVGRHGKERIVGQGFPVSLSGMAGSPAFCA